MAQYSLAIEIIAQTPFTQLSLITGQFVIHGSLQFICETPVQGYYWFQNDPFTAVEGATGNNRISFVPSPITQSGNVLQRAYVFCEWGSHSTVVVHWTAG